MSMDDKKDGPKEYKIPVENWYELTMKIEKLNKRAAKLGCDPIVVSILRTEDVEIFKGEHGAGRPTGEFRRYNIATVEGKAPVLNGWKFIATLQHVTVTEESDTKKMTLVRTVPGETVPKEYQAAENWCDQCKTDRYRTDTFIVRHENGEVKQVGRQCLKDFLGHKDPEKLADWATYLASLGSMMEEAEEDRGYGGGRRLIGLQAYLNFVAEAIQQKGWVSRKKVNEIRSKDGGVAEATADLAQFWMSPPPKVPLQDHVRPSDKAKELAVKALDWARETLPQKIDPSDYEHNLRVVSSLEIIEHNMLGLAASIIPYYQRATEQQVNHDNSVWFGERGKREDFTLTVEKVIPYEKQGYGYGGITITYIHKMRDPNGNAAVWFSSNKKLEEGKTYQVKATVKDFKEYKGHKETALTRVKVIEGEDRETKKAMESRVVETPLERQPK